MTTEQVTQQQLNGAMTVKKPVKRISRVSGPRSATKCECLPGIEPDPGPFEITNLKGIRCGKCMHVFSWEKTGDTTLEQHVKNIKMSAPRSPEKQAHPQMGITEDREFLVTDISRVIGQPSHMYFHMDNVGKNFKVSFCVLVPSQEDRVEKAMNDKTRIVGKYAKVEFNGFDANGIPLLPKVLGLKQS